ncbi:MAG: hypothetical protein QOC94_704 [Actinoplanes sp.]|jgi:hypothetical protein|nr:hypothetical protein [Actinoplanes sp.]
MPLYLLIPILAGVALFGWVAGMWTHKRAERWCPVDGLRLECVQCRQRAGLDHLQSQGMRS